MITAHVNTMIDSLLKKPTTEYTVQFYDCTYATERLVLTTI